MEVDCNLTKLIFRQDAILVKLTFQKYFFLLVDICLLSPLSAFFFSCCKTVKRNYSKLQAILNKIFNIRRDSVPLMILKKIFHLQLKRPSHFSTITV